MHRQYASVLGEAYSNLTSLVPGDFDFTVVKWNVITGAFTFIECVDFDTGPEPTVGRQCLIRADTTVAIRIPSADPYIYHHKWLFVKDDYEGFDIEESKRRSLQWMSLPNIDYARIGRLSYWKANVLPRIGKGF